MNTEGYRIQKIDQMPEVINVGRNSNVAPFPVRRWQEPLPIAVEGVPLAPREEAPEVKKTVARFYPPLLFFSTLLTGAFLYLYLTKPVIVEAPAVLSKVGNAAAQTPQGMVPSPSQESALLPPVGDLMPFPDEMSLPGEGSSAQGDLHSDERPPEEAFSPTTLLAEQVVQVESLNGELEEYTVSLPVFYPEGMLSWSEGSQAEALRLTIEMEAHLDQVRELQASGLRLLEEWNGLVEASKPSPVLIPSENTIPPTGE